MADDNGDGGSPYDGFLSEDERVAKALGIFDKKGKEDQAFGDKEASGDAGASEDSFGTSGEQTEEKAGLFGNVKDKAKRVLGKREAAGEPEQPETEEPEQPEGAPGQPPGADAEEPGAEEPAGVPLDDHMAEIRKENEAKERWAEENKGEGQYEGRTPVEPHEASREEPAPDADAGADAGAADEDASPEDGAARQAGDADEQAALNAGVNLRHAKKFLRSAGEVAIENWGDAAAKGWGMAQNLVKMTLTDSGAISSSSRFISNAITGMETASDMASRAAQRYGIDVNADPALIKDTLRYRLYKQERDNGQAVVGNTFRAISESLARNGGDISQMTSEQLGRHVGDMRAEEQRLRQSLDDPSLKPGQRKLIGKQADHLAGYMRDIAKQAADRNYQAGRDARAEKFRNMELRRQSYDMLDGGSPNPLSNLLHSASPTFNIDVDSATGFPKTEQGVNTLIKTANAELQRLSGMDQNDPAVQRQTALVQKQQQALGHWKSQIVSGGNYNTVMGSTGDNRFLAEMSRLNPYIAYNNGRVAAEIINNGYWSNGTVTANMRDRIAAMMGSSDPQARAIGTLYNNSINASNMYQQSFRFIDNVIKNNGVRDSRIRAHKRRLELLRDKYMALDNIDTSAMQDDEKATIDSVKEYLMNQMQMEEEASVIVSSSGHDNDSMAYAKSCLDVMHSWNKHFMTAPDGGASFDPNDPDYADVLRTFENKMRTLQFIYGNADAQIATDRKMLGLVSQYTGAGAGAGAGATGGKGTGKKRQHGTYTYDYSKWGSDDHAKAIAASLGIADVPSVRRSIRSLAPMWNLIFQNSKGGISSAKLSGTQRAKLEKALDYAKKYNDAPTVALLERRLGTSGPREPDPVSDVPPDGGDGDGGDAHVEEPEETEEPEEPVKEEVIEEDEEGDEEARYRAVIQSLADKGLLKLDDDDKEPDTILLRPGVDKRYPTAQDKKDAYWAKKDLVDKIESALADPEKAGLSEDEIEYLTRFKTTLDDFIREDEFHYDEWEKEARGDEEEDRRGDAPPAPYAKYDEEGYAQGLIDADKNKWYSIFHTNPELPKLARELFGNDYSQEALADYADVYKQTVGQRPDLAGADGGIDPVKAAEGLGMLKDSETARRLLALVEPDETLSDGGAPPGNEDERPNVLGENWNSGTGDYFSYGMMEFDDPDLNKLTHKSKGYQSFNKGLRTFMEDMGGAWNENTTAADIRPYGIAYMRLNKALGTDGKTHKLNAKPTLARRDKLRELMEDRTVDEAAMEHIRAFVEKNKQLLEEEAAPSKDPYVEARGKVLKDMALGKDARNSASALLDRFHDGEFKGLLPEGAIETEEGMKAVLALRGLFRGTKAPWTASSESTLKGYTEKLDGILKDANSSHALSELAENIKAKIASKQSKPPIKDLYDRLDNSRDEAIAELKEYLVETPQGEYAQYGFDPDEVKEKALDDYLKKFDYSGANVKGIKSTILKKLNAPLVEHQKERVRELKALFDTGKPQKTPEDRAKALESVSPGIVQRTEALCKEFIKGLGEVIDGREYRKTDLKREDAQKIGTYVMGKLKDEGLLYDFPELGRTDAGLKASEAFTDYLGRIIRPYSDEARQKWNDLEQYKPPKKNKKEPQGRKNEPFSFTHDGTEYTFDTFEQAVERVAGSENPLEDKKATLSAMFKTLVNLPSRTGRANAMGAITNAYKELTGQDYETAKNELQGMATSGPDDPGNLPDEPSNGDRDAKRSSKTWTRYGEKWSWKKVEEKLRNLEDEPKESRMEVLEDIYCAIDGVKDLQSNMGLVNQLINRYSNESGIESPTEAGLKLRTISEGRKAIKNMKRTKEKRKGKEKSHYENEMSGQ